MKNITITTLSLALLFTCSIRGMQINKVTQAAPTKLDPAWELAKLKILGNQEPSLIAISGFTKESQTPELKVELQRALITSLQAVNLTYADEQSTEPLVTIDATKLQQLTTVLERLKKAQDMIAKLGHQSYDKTLAEMMLKRDSIDSEHDSLQDALRKFHLVSWEDETTRQGILLKEKTALELTLARTQLDNEIRSLDKEGRRFDQNFLKTWGLIPAGKTEEKPIEKTAMTLYKEERNRRGNSMCNW